jgi:hypothetical protein
MESISYGCPPIKHGKKHQDLTGYAKSPISEQKGRYKTV